MRLAPAVDRGARLLDEKRPGWEREIDLGKLDMESDCNCVLGQLWGWYADGLWALDGRYSLSYYYAGRNGFELPLSSGDEKRRLTTLWRRRIEKRLAA